MSPASTASMSAATAVAQLGGEVGQILAHARLERRRLGAHRRGGGLQHLLARAQPLLGAPDPLLQLGERQLERPAVDRQALAHERRQTRVASASAWSSSSRRRSFATVAPSAATKASIPDPARSPASARLADTGKIAGSGTIAARCLRAKASVSASSASSSRSVLATTNSSRSRVERRMRSSRNCRSEAVRICVASSRKTAASARGR